MRYRVIQALIVIALILGCASFAQFTQANFVEKRNHALLTEAATQLLRRAELAVDYSIETLGNQIEIGVESCSQKGLLQARSAVFNRGLIKDIEVLREPFRLECSASETPTFLNDSYLERFVTKNQDISIQALNKSTNGLVRVRWRQPNDLTLAVILNLDSLLYDLFPSELRESSNAQIVLGEKYTLAKFGDNTNVVTKSYLVKFVAASDRFPLKVQMEIPAAEIANWNSGSYAMPVSVGGLIGALFGMALVIHFSRPISMIDELRTAIERGEIKPFFQPTFSLANRSIVGCEVLVRWIKLDGTMIGPDQFIPVAESTGLIVPLTERLFKDTFSLLGAFVRDNDYFKVAFNVTPRHFVSDDFLSKLLAQIQLHDFPRQGIVIELTERQSMDDAGRVANAATAVREAGLRIALDDTGSGHNGLSHVQDVPLDIIKIDKKFVDLIGSNVVAASIVEMLVRLAKDIRATTIAEGIETESQLIELRRLGVQYGQGYLVSPALNISAFLKFMTENTISASERAIVKLERAA